MLLGQFLDDLLKSGVGRYRRQPRRAAVIFAQRGLDVLLGGDPQFDFRVEQMRRLSMVLRSEGSASGDGDVVVAV